MAYRITVVSLGPGSRELLTLGALEEMKKAGRLILRTGLTDAALYLREQGYAFDTLDDLHETCSTFEELTRACVKRVRAAAKEKNVCYAVLDAARDESARELLNKRGTRALPGVSLAGPALAACPEENVLVETASGLSVASTSSTLCVCELDNRVLAGECKLKLLARYAPDTVVLFFPPSAQAERRYKSITLDELDRQKHYDHTVCAVIPAVPLTEKKRFDFYDLERVMAVLRSPGGCPWDREQTHASLRPYLIEESYEAADAIDREDWDQLYDELGDVLLQVVFHASIAESTGDFELSDITTAICKKMIRRHRHIFGGDDCPTAEAVALNWEKIKREERGTKSQSEVLKEVVPGMEPLLRAAKVQKKARDVGFDWDDPKDALQKVHEEADEVLEALREGNADRIEDELGDLFFSCVNTARLAGADSQKCLHRATEKFISRFTRMENAVKSDGKSLKDLTLSEMDVYWNGCKHEAGL